MHFFSISKGRNLLLYVNKSLLLLKSIRRNPKNENSIIIFLILMSFQTHLILFLLNSTQNKFSRSSVLYISCCLLYFFCSETYLHMCICEDQYADQ